MLKGILLAAELLGDLKGVTGPKILFHIPIRDIPPGTVSDTFNLPSGNSGTQPAPTQPVLRSGVLGSECIMGNFPHYLVFFHRDAILLRDPFKNYPCFSFPSPKRRCAYFS